MDILKQFGVQPVLLAAQVVNFLILLFILKKFLYGPILKVLQQRKETIAQSLKNTEEIEARLQKTEEESRKVMAKALTEAQKILDQTNEAATQILDKANKQAEQILVRATADGKKIVELQKAVLMNQIRNSVGSLVSLVFEKVTGQKVTLEDQKKIIEKEVKNLS